MLKSLYSKIWMPLFGRMLFNFVEAIEGKKSKKNPTYKFTKENDPQ